MFKIFNKYFWRIRKSVRRLENSWIDIEVHCQKKLNVQCTHLFYLDISQCMYWVLIYLNVLFEFTKILSLSENYWWTIGDLDMFHLRLTCPFGDRHADRRPIGELDMFNRRPTCPVRDRYAWSETHQRPTCLRSPIGI